MYLDLRPNGYRFQFAVPTDLSVLLGRTSIRILLGLIPNSEARRRARLLSGHAERLFMAARAYGYIKMDKDPRDSTIAELKATPDETIKGYEERNEESSARVEKLH